MSQSADTRRDFVALATELSLLTNDTAVEIASLAASQNVAASQLALNRGLLSAAQFDIVETLLHPTELVPGYEILNLLGQGGMGVVYRARQSNLDRVVALKTVLVSHLADPQAAARFEQEAVTVAKLRHPHVVAAYDYGQSRGRLYFAMELIEGEDVEQLVSRLGRLDEKTAWGLARQAAAGLAEAARLGVVHRDIKPANLLLVEPPLGFPLPPGLPLVKIADFGLALLTSDVELQARLTTAGSAVGSPHYMAPEQLDGSDIDTRADMYALGASVFHMLAGQPPFHGKSLSQIIAAKLGQTPPSVLDLRSDVSPASAQLVSEMMSPSRGDRPIGYAGLLDRIDALVGRQPLDTVVMTSVPTPATDALAANMKSAIGRRWWIGASLLIVAILACVTAIGVVMTHQPKLPAKPHLGSTGWAESLFDGRTLRGWLPPQGGTWNVTRDEEQARVIAGSAGLLRRPLGKGDGSNRSALELYRLTLFVNPRDAEAVEVQFGIPQTGDEPGKYHALRITRDGAQLVERASAKDAPIRSGKHIPLLRSGSGYHVVKLDRTSGHYWAYLDDQLVGIAPSGREPERPEFRLWVEGGPAWFSDLEVEELTTQAEPTGK